MFVAKIHGSEYNYCTAVAEPPLCLACSVPLAIRNAVASVRTEANKTCEKWYPFCKRFNLKYLSVLHFFVITGGPSTVENVFLNCLHNYKHYTL
jgi:xanthine dehydrogenase/oxidase